MTLHQHISRCSSAVTFFILVVMCSGCVSVTHGDYKSVRAVPIYRSVTTGYGNIVEFDLFPLWNWDGIEVYQNY